MRCTPWLQFDDDRNAAAADDDDDVDDVEVVARSSWDFVLPQQPSFSYNHFFSMLFSVLRLVFLFLSPEFYSVLPTKRDYTHRKHV